MSQQAIDFIPRSIKSSSNLRRISQSTKKIKFTTNIQQISRPKFKQIVQQNSTRQQQGTNELDSKYNVYKHGSPNFYSYSIESHKANNLKNQIQTLDLPFIDGVIRELNNGSLKGNNTTNLRDYDLYPNLLKTHQTHKFRDLLSDKQELRDFLKWFHTNCLLIDQKQIPITKKFQQKQIIISSGFGQITGQINKLSKNRSEILKMLWNRQTEQVQQIIEHLTCKVIQMQRQHLSGLSEVHEQYQQQVDQLKRQNIQLRKKLNDQTFTNSAYINSLRCNRKVIKKQQLLVKKLIDTNSSKVKQNLNLMDQNTKLIMECSMLIGIQENGKFIQKRHKRTNSSTLKQSQTQELQQNKQELKFSQARLLMYRRLQIQQKKSLVDKQIRQLKKCLISEIHKKSQDQVKLHPLNRTQLQDKKQSLYNYLINRLKSNPYQKLYLGDDFFHQDDHNLDIDQIESAIKKILNTKEIQIYFKHQQHTQRPLTLKSIGINTTKQYTQ